LANVSRRFFRQSRELRRGGGGHQSSHPLGSFDQLVNQEKSYRQSLGEFKRLLLPHGKFRSMT
jgi:hypothetical protein